MTFDPTQGQELNRTGAGRPAVVPKISTYQAKQEALLMIRRGLVRPTTKLYHVIGLLGTTGVLPEKNVLELGQVAVRTLTRYRKNGILDVVPIPGAVRKWLNPKRLWTLGPIGIQLAKLQFDLVPTGYLESKIDNITHDVLCNYVYCSLYEASKNTEYTVILKSRYEVGLKDFRNNLIVQPDGMITLRHETGKQAHFLIEYHNENFSSRAAEKITRYEQVRRKGEWRDQWHLEKFPPILIVSTHRAPTVGYKEEIGTRKVGCQYLIKSLKSFLSESEPAFVWLDLNQNKTVNILDLV